jgi:hypothetical protein
MFMPTAADPPITRITADERQALREYLGNYVENEQYDIIRPLMFVLVLSGDKPAATIQPSRDAFPDHPWVPQTGLKQLCDRLNVVAHHRRALSWWFVAPVDGRLDLLPSNDRAERNEAWVRRLGVILGYPPPAIECFIEKAGEWTEPHELVVTGQFSPEEMADAGFIVYRHDDSVEGYEWAVRHGRRVRQRLEALAEQWDVPELTAFIDGHRTYLRDAARPETPVQ